MLPLTLPTELIETIIDHLSSDTKSLSALSLVSWICLPRARRHMFAILDIQLSTPHHFRIFSLLQSPIARRTSIPFIHTFSISRIQVSVFKQGAERVLEAIRDLPKLVSPLYNIESLRISKSNLGHLSDPIVSELISVMKSRLKFVRLITSLTFSELDFRDSAVLEDFLGGMVERYSSGLECVTIERVKYGGSLSSHSSYRNIFDNSPRRPSPITWNLLGLRGHDLYDFTGWLLGSTDAPIPARLQVIHLQPMIIEHSFAFRSLLTSKTPSYTEWIKDLTFWFPLWAAAPGGEPIAILVSNCLIIYRNHRHVVSTALLHHSDNLLPFIEVLDIETNCSLSRRSGFREYQLSIDAHTRNIPIIRLEDSIVERDFGDHDSELCASLPSA